MERVLVTGGAGFIGSHLCHALLQRGFRVACLDNFSTGKGSNIEFLRKNRNFSYYAVDVNKKLILEKAFQTVRPNYVFHYAATVGVKRVLEDQFAPLEDIEGIKNILYLSLRNKVKKVIYASSSEVYGESPQLPQKENGILNPLLSYGAVKLIGEHFCQAYYKKYGLPTCALRFFNVYGPRQEGSDYGFVVSIFINQVLRGERPTVFGDGLQTRDFTYVSDNVNAALLAMMSEKADGQIFNVGTEKCTSILNLALKIIKISGKSLTPEFLPERSEFEITHRLPDVSKIKKALGFKAKIDLEKGLQKTIEYYNTRKRRELLNGSIRN
jgi:UDP-glucose 4-epimerase